MTKQTTAQQLQDSLQKEVPRIAVMARPQKNGKILLRWAVTTPRAWRKSNAYGYELRRYTILRNKQTLAKPEEIRLGIFLPKPLEEWMKIVEDDDNAAVMAQSLYGETFSVEGMDKLSLIINLSEEQQQRFTWALYIADQDYEIAQFAGLGFVDITAKANEKYVYKVTSMVPENELKIEEGGVFIGLQDYEELPKPLDLAASFLDEKVILNWNYAIHKKIYNSYFIERSEDGKTYKKLNDLPITGLNNSEKTNPKRMFYIDSIANNKTYHYRIKGATPFGEFSPLSEAVSGKATKILPYTPRITNKNYLDNKRILLDWEFPIEGNDHISGFELNRSDKATGTYKTIIKDIPATTRKILYDDMQPTNYLTITAIGKNGSSRTSFAALIQPVDSIPPAKPVAFEGKVDSLGIVTLKWKANTETDMLGYRVFRGNNKTEEYSQITVAPHRGTVYYDSISVKNLNNKVYYTLVAVDQRFNMSESSEILEIVKPDFIAPRTPVFKSYNITETAVVLQWENSSSTDVVKHEIYRKEKDSINWKLMHTVLGKQLAVNSDVQTNVSLPADTDLLNTATDTLPTEHWQDTNTIQGKQYSYTIVAVDESNLSSEQAKPLTVIIPKSSLKPAIQKLRSYVDKKNGFIELYWKQYTASNVAELMIYKGLKDKPITLFRNIPPTIKRIVDDKVKPNNEYVYLMRAVFTDGSISEIVELNVKY